MALCYPTRNSRATPGMEVLPPAELPRHLEAQSPVGASIGEPDEEIRRDRQRAGELHGEEPDELQRVVVGAVFDDGATPVQHAAHRELGGQCVTDSHTRGRTVAKVLAA